MNLIVKKDTADKYQHHYHFYSHLNGYLYYAFTLHMDTLEDIIGRECRDYIDMQIIKTGEAQANLSKN